MSFYRKTFDILLKKYKFLLFDSLEKTDEKRKGIVIFQKNKVVTFIYNDKFIMYSDSWRYHLIIIDSIAEAVSE